MRKRRIFSIALTCALVLGILSGCGSSGNYQSDTSSAMSGISAGNSFGYSDSKTADIDSVQAEELAPEGSQEAPAEAEVPSPQEQEVIPTEKIVYTGSVQLDTMDYDKSISEIKALILANNCIVASSNEANYDSSWRDSSYNSSAREYSWRILVPAKNFSKMMDDLDSITGHVNSKSQDAENLTRQYSETASKIASLKTQESRLLTFMEQAKDISEMLEIEDRLADVRYEIETLQNQNNDIDLRVQYSTLPLTVNEVVDYDTTGMSFGQRVVQAFSNSTSGFVHVIQGIIILVILLLPYLIIAAIVGIILVATRSKREAARLKKKEKLDRKHREGSAQNVRIPADRENTQVCAEKQDVSQDGEHSEQLDTTAQDSEKKHQGIIQ